MGLGKQQRVAQVLRPLSPHLGTTNGRSLSLFSFQSKIKVNKVLKVYKSGNASPKLFLIHRKLFLCHCFHERHKRQNRAAYLWTFLMLSPFPRSQKYGCCIENYLLLLYSTTLFSLSVYTECVTE